MEGRISLRNFIPCFLNENYGQRPRSFIIRLLVGDWNE